MATLPAQWVVRSLRAPQTSKCLNPSFYTSLSRGHSARRISSHSDLISPSRPKSRRTFATTYILGQTSPSSSASSAAAAPAEQSIVDSSELTSGLDDNPLPGIEGQVDWSRSFHGLSAEAFSKEAADTLLAPIDPEDVEVKPDGILYLPEIKYRRILNKAFGPGGWGMAPRGETIVTSKAVTREYSLVVLGRLVSIARGEQDYFSPEGIPTAAEGCKSNALMRCCKDIGIASELWDPRFIRKFLKENVQEVWAEHVVTKKKKKIYLRKGMQPNYPYKAS